MLLRAWSSAGPPARWSLGDERRFVLSGGVVGGFSAGGLGWFLGCPGRRARYVGSWS